MNIKVLQQLYANLPQGGAFAQILENKSINTVFLRGIVASSAPMFFSSVAPKIKKTFVFILQDADEAGYFYNDMMSAYARKHTNDEPHAAKSPKDESANADENSAAVLFFPSSYRRATKYGQRDPANEILRT